MTTAMLLFFSKDLNLSAIDGKPESTRHTAASGPIFWQPL